MDIPIKKMCADLVLLKEKTYREEAIQVTHSVPEEKASQDAAQESIPSFATRVLRQYSEKTPPPSATQSSSSEKSTTESAVFIKQAVITLEEKPLSQLSKLLTKKSISEC